MTSVRETQKRSKKMKNNELKDEQEIKDGKKLKADEEIQHKMISFTPIGNSNYEDINDIVSVKFRDTSYTLVNSLIRTMLSDVETVCIDCDADNIRENNTIYDSQFMAYLRLSLISIITNTNMLEEYKKYHIYLAGDTIEVPFENKTNDILPVYVHDLKITKDQEDTTKGEPSVIPPLSIIKYDHLLLKLHKGQRIHIYNAKLSKNNGRSHSRFQSIIVRKFLPDIETSICDCVFETQGNLSISDAVYTGLRVLRNKFEKLEKTLIKYVNDKVFVSFIIEQAQNEQNYLDLCVADSDGHTMDNTSSTFGTPRLVKLLIYGETETVGEMLFKYSYLLTEQYKLMNAQDLIFKMRKTHVDEEKLLVAVAFEQTQETAITFEKMSKDYFPNQSFGGFPQQIVLLCCVCKHIENVLEKNISTGITF